MSGSARFERNEHVALSSDELSFGVYLILKRNLRAKSEALRCLEPLRG